MGRLAKIIKLVMAGHEETRSGDYLEHGAWPLSIAVRHLSFYLFLWLPPPFKVWLYILKFWIFWCAFQRKTQQQTCIQNLSHTIPLLHCVRLYFSELYRKGSEDADGPLASKYLAAVVTGVCEYKNKNKKRKKSIVQGNNEETVAVVYHTELAMIIFWVRLCIMSKWCT